jgi:hypothetical protein
LGIIWAVIGISASSESQTVVDLRLVCAGVVAIVLVAGLLWTRMRPVDKVKI